MGLKKKKKKQQPKPNIKSLHIIVQHDPILQKLSETKLILNDMIYTLEAQLSLCTHFRQGAYQLQ